MERNAAAGREINRRLSPHEALQVEIPPEWIGHEPFIEDFSFSAEQIRIIARETSRYMDPENPKAYTHPDVIRLRQWAADLNRTGRSNRHQLWTLLRLGVRIGLQTLKFKREPS